MSEYSSPFLHSIDVLWKDIRVFAFRNRTIFEALFILLYALEQVALVLLTYADPYDIGLIVSVFALAVLTTFSLHKLVMESRIKWLEAEVSGLQVDMGVLTSEVEQITRRYKDLASRVQAPVKKARFKYVKDANQINEVITNGG